ncbi:helix-turn-helix domain-containing protein [Endozoicomonas montiporae]|uniref:Transcriptional regulator n=1 Tax=Endozoicomonas montiporae CL-33 TaxID=570277 RepID=A0A142B6X9_9GAMM|nr:XRE family transcriptional regulator [Endozoicomonas montiporae]AMO54505.1 transcriptional regulator [Endozoicomonas montiporae CL-33]
MHHNDFRSQIANHLKAIRKDKGWSLDKTAEATAVSKAMLGQIERQESSPTIATLWKIASGLETSFSAFFATRESLRRSETTFPDDLSMQVKTLFPYSNDTHMEMFEITLTKFHHQLSSPHAIGVIEHCCVIEGTIELQVGNAVHRLEKGDSFKFHADQEHSYKAVTETAVFHNIVCYPSMAEFTTPNPRVKPLAKASAPA